MTVATVAKIYPIPPDDRLTDEVVELVADLLTHRGYPFIDDGADLDRLREALRQFLYGPDGDIDHGLVRPYARAGQRPTARHALS